MVESVSKRNTSFFSRISCFAASECKPVHTSEKQPKEVGNEANKTESDLFKFKFSAQKIYANIKKMSLVTNFFSSVFTNGESKKVRESGYANDVNADLNVKSAQRSTCVSLACSLSRSCVSTTSMHSRQKRNKRVKKSVRFCPVDVVVDEDCHQTTTIQPKLDHKRNDDVDHKRNDDVDHKRNDVVSDSYENLKNYDFVLDFLRTRMMIFEEDCSYDWTSDLVELERLTSLKN